MALGQRRRHKKKFIPPKLQITSMMDMFTIILIFLLFSFSNEPEPMDVDKSLILPMSNANLQYKERLKLSMTKTALKLGNQQIAAIRDGKIIGLNPDDLADSSLYKKLKTTLALSQQENTEKNGPLTFLCDKDLPFRAINNVMKTAAMAGYPDFSFAVLKK